MTISPETAAEIALLRARADQLEQGAEPTTAPAPTSAVEPKAQPLTHRFEAANLHALRAASAFNGNQNELIGKLIDAVSELQAQHQPDGHA